jgi:hypothetical protein
MMMIWHINILIIFVYDELPYCPLEERARASRDKKHMTLLALNKQTRRAKFWIFIVVKYIVP